MALDPWAGIGIGLSGLLTGYNQGRAANAQRELENRRLDLSEKQIKSAIAKSGLEAQKEGYRLNDLGEYEPDPAFYTAPGEKPYVPETPTSTATQTFSGMMDKPLGQGGMNLAPQPAQGMDLGSPAYRLGERKAYLERMSKGQNNDPSHYDLSQFADNPTIKGAGFTREQLMNVPKGHPLIKIAESLYKPRSLLDGPATPEQEAAFAKLLNLDPAAAKGISRKGFESAARYVRGQEAAGDRQGKAIAATDARSAAGREQKQAIHEENKNLQEEKAVMDPVAEINSKLAGLERLGSHIDSAAVFQPSWSDYKATQAKFGAQGVLGGYTPNFAKPNKEDEARYEYYQSLRQDYVRTLFESGGKALTQSEQALAGRLEINPGDTLEQIRNKGRSIKAHLNSRLGAQIQSIERVNPRAAADLRERLNAVMMDLDQRLMNASQRRARGKTSGDSPNAPPSEREASAARLGLSNPDILSAIDNPENKTKNEAGMKAHSKAAPRLYGKKPQNKSDISSAPPGMSFEEFKKWKAANGK